VDEPLIQAVGLTKRYGPRTVVDALDLEVRRGEIYGLLGPNGAGKTTTILMLLGLSEPDAGRARVVGLDPTRHALEVKRRVGYLPDDAGFYADLTGRQNLRYTAALNGLTGRAAETRISEVLEQVGLVEGVDRKAGQYSRGMRQRLGIADALVKDPSVLILDEPTIGIDPLGVVEILGLIRRLVSDRSLALLLASHLLDQVQATCDRVGIFYAGRLIGEGSVAQLAERFGGDHARLAVAFDETQPGAFDRSATEALLRTVPGVAAVTLVDLADPTSGLDTPLPLHTVGWIVGLAEGASTATVRQELLRRVGEAGLPLAELRLLVPSLGETYRRAVEGEADARADAEADAVSVA
jgi:ABC-2 type transport system ATP-binding protein